MALSMITSNQAKGTESMMKKCKQLLDYLSTHPAANHVFIPLTWYWIFIWMHLTDQRQTHMGWRPDPAKPIILSGAFFMLCSILCFVVASASKAELGTLFLNCKQALIFWLALEETGHPEPPLQSTAIINCSWHHQQHFEMPMLMLHGNAIRLGCWWCCSKEVWHQILLGEGESCRLPE